MRWFICIIIVGTFNMARSYSHDDLERLMTDLFNETRYNKEIRPIWNQSDRMLVDITEGLYELDSLDVTAGHMVVVAYFKIFWMDEYLIWNPADYAGIDRISVHYKKIWEPEIVQKGGVHYGNARSIINEGFSRAFVFPNGQVVLMTGGYYGTTCDIDTRLYPFDTHTCRFMFFSLKHPMNELILKSPLNKLILDLYVHNDAWEIHDSEVISEEVEVDGVTLPVMTNKITVKRRPEFVFLNRYFPLFLLSVLNSMSCLVPADSGERFSFAVTMYLSFVFMTVSLVDEFPQNALHMPLSSYGVLIINVFNTTSVLWSVLIVRISKRNADKIPIPEKLLKLVMWSQRNAQSNRKVLPVLDESSDIGLEDYKEETKQDLSDVQKNENTHKEGSSRCNDITWLHVTNVLDKIFFAVMLLLVALVMISILSYWVIRY